MIVDSSAVLAILLGEAEAERFADCIASAPRPRMSMVSVLETTAVALRRLRMNLTLVIQFLDATGVILTPPDERQLILAGEALERFGRGRHPAGLNFGDCFSYALARSLGEPLLFNGNDFARTDVLPAVLP